MAVNLQEAQAKWARNAVAGAKNWHGDPAAYCRGLAKFGISEAQCMAGAGQRYQSGIAAVTPGQFQAAVQSAAQTDKWARRYIEGLSR